MTEHSKLASKGDLRFTAEGERYSTTIERMSFERAQTIKMLRQENDSLKV